MPLRVYTRDDAEHVRGTPMEAEGGGGLVAPRLLSPKLIWRVETANPCDDPDRRGNILAFLDGPGRGY